MGAAWTEVIWAGFVGTTLATSLFWILRSLGATEVSPTGYVGCFFLRNPAHPATETLGLLVVFLAGALPVAALYALLLTRLEALSWQSGALLGGVHGLLAAALLSPLGTVSACIRAGALRAPGRFGLRWGRLTPLVMMAGHAVYGAVVAAILAGFAPRAL